MRTDEDLTCQELVELVTDYLDGGLADRDRERFEEHIVFCSGCENYLDQMRTTIDVVGALTEDDLAPAMADELLAAFRGWKAEQ
jgi:anti-sigma factor RsiW